MIRCEYVLIPLSVTVLIISTILVSRVSVIDVEARLTSPPSPLDCCHCQHSLPPPPTWVSKLHDRAWSSIGDPYVSLIMSQVPDGTSLLMDLSTTTKKLKFMQYSTNNYVGICTRVFVVRKSQWIMVCSTPIAPAVTMVGGSCSRRGRKFPAILWLIVISSCAVLGDCGCLSWLRSEPCFLSPVGLGGNWYILLQL